MAWHWGCQNDSLRNHVRRRPLRSRGTKKNYVFFSPRSVILFRVFRFSSLNPTAVDPELLICDLPLKRLPATLIRWRRVRQTSSNMNINMNINITNCRVCLQSDNLRPFFDKSKTHAANFTYTTQLQVKGGISYLCLCGAQSRILAGTPVLAPRNRAF